MVSYNIDLINQTLVTPKAQWHCTFSTDTHNRKNNAVSNTWRGCHGQLSCVNVCEKKQVPKGTYSPTAGVALSLAVSVGE